MVTHYQGNDIGGKGMCIYSKFNKRRKVEVYNDRMSLDD